MMASELLDLLIDATPYPPGGDVEAILVAYRAMFDRRQDIMAEMTGLLIDGLDQSRVRELGARQEAWQVALAAARERTNAQRIGVTQLRAYAR
jgi:hypothetical protein